MISEKRMRIAMGITALCAISVSVALLAVAALFPKSPITDVILATHVTFERPKIFGGFHLTMLAICIVLTALVFIFQKSIPKKYLDPMVFSSGLFLLAAEVYKQLYYHIVLGNGHYNFGILPFQLCSYSLYLFIVVPLLPEGRIKRALYSFCALYQTMGGCIVMAYPTLYKELSLSLHTMLWHTVMILTGILILKHLGFGRRLFSDLLPATLIFLCTLTVAVSLNFLLTPYTASSPAPLNLFYMSPYQTNNYLIISQVRESLGWFPSLLCYALLFICVGAPLVWLVGKITGNKSNIK